MHEAKSWTGQESLSWGFGSHQKAIWEFPIMDGFWRGYERILSLRLRKFRKRNEISWLFTRWFGNNWHLNPRYIDLWEELSK